MANNLNMEGLSINENARPNGMGGGRSTYIPPHARSSGRGGHYDGPPRGAPAGVNGSAWAPSG